MILVPRWNQHELDLIAKYSREKFGREVDMKTLEEAPNHKRWLWINQANAYFGLMRTFENFEQIPEEYKVDQSLISIMHEGVKTDYRWYRGNWVKGGESFEDMFKG